MQTLPQTKGHQQYTTIETKCEAVYHQVHVFDCEVHSFQDQPEHKNGTDKVRRVSTIDLPSLTFLHH